MGKIRKAVFAYNSAIQDKSYTRAQPCDRWEGERLTALRHEVSVHNDIPKEFLRCDVFYSEPAWRAGMKTFNTRAGSRCDFRDYLRGVQKFIELGKPTVLTASKNHMKALGAPAFSCETTIVSSHNCRAQLMFYNFDYDGPTRNSVQVIYNLAQRFDCVGDFSCGFGNTGRIFLRNGKRAVLSDYDATCVGYIASQGELWSAS